jgi:hypothetical protein
MVKQQRKEIGTSQAWNVNRMTVADMNGKGKSQID